MRSPRPLRGLAMTYYTLTDFVSNLGVTRFRNPLAFMVRQPRIDTLGTRIHNPIDKTSISQMVHYLYRRGNHLYYEHKSYKQIYILNIFLFLFFKSHGEKNLIHSAAIMIIRITDPVIKTVLSLFFDKASSSLFLLSSFFLFTSCTFSAIRFFNNTSSFLMRCSIVV
jgi:hypothetical protein